MQITHEYVQENTTSYIQVYLQTSKVVSKNWLARWTQQQLVF